LERVLIHGEANPQVGLSSYPELARANGVFVTLRREGSLRGCIGRITTDEPLATTVPIVALDAALRDPRFQPVRGDELDGIHIEVSVLTPPARLPHPQDLVAGRDGVVLESQGRSGVFLPAVWTETGWTRVEFLRELASQKAGLDPDAWKEAALYIFQDQVFEEAH
jgi:AmmeMemoRadiSam system protein A